ncbi:hypothetical protein Ndes2437B_g06794 [Nannochloris sp. 'desiccata']
MEWSPACGVLGVPISLQYQSQTGPVSCSVTQLFAKVILDIPHALLLASEEEGADSKTQKLLDTNVGVEFSEDAIILKNSAGDIAVEVHPWGALAPQSCQWHSTENHSLHITLVKAPTSLGSWPYSLQSLVLKPSNNDREHTNLCNHDKDAFNNHADALLASHIAKTRALKAAFSHAIAEQMSTLPCGPLGQSAFLFPQQGPHCFEFLKRCYSQNIPSVHKLVRLAHNLTGILLIEDIEQELEEEEAMAMPPPPSFTLSSSFSFYSLRSLVGCLIAGLAAVEHYRFHHGLDAIKSITACIGFGAGEYAAAVFAGALRLHDALVAIKAHAQALPNEEEHDDSSRYFEQQNQVDYDIQGCSSRGIDAVRAALAGNERQHNKNAESTNSATDTCTATPTAAIKLPEEIEPTAIRSPRLRIYSGADGVVYENNAADILNALPYGVCAAHAAVSHRHDVRVALMQQGVAEMIVLVPEEGDEEGEVAVEEEEEEKEVVKDEKTLPFE